MEPGGAWAGSAWLREVVLPQAVAGSGLEGTSQGEVRLIGLSSTPAFHPGEGLELDECLSNGDAGFAASGPQRSFAS